MTWRAISAGKTFEDEGELLVFYSLANGSTHHISRLAAFIIELLLEAPASTEAILEEVLAEADDAPLAETREAVLRLLEELQEFELIEAD